MQTIFSTWQHCKMASKEESTSQTIEISPSLGLPQLNSLKNNLDQELTLLQESIQNLKMAQQKFQDSNECLEAINPEFDGKEILVPLTGSVSFYGNMYVPGKLKDPNSVLINIGTGYYAEKNLEEGKEYFVRKVNFITEQMEKIQAIGLEKSRIRDALQDMVMKMVQSQVGQQPGGAAPVAAGTSKS
ncbi:hypothetical protein B566_EDAN003049 [Ephemera danica]|nr:hypothetical protein B566_EDAN003049 [Ephemera danica]